MTCRQLGGACDMKFHADNFEDMAAQSRKHGMEMFEAGDFAHLKAMKEMQNTMKSPGAMEEWMKAKKKEFKELPNS